ncbi:OmpA family protein [uncultured Kriegella sp.]|uniref:OmpA family protein n=1 Tax=uncultured Kriegella sp. TaxID=1798910 RepID=UPI0030D79A95|tara:strand:- start:56352 stop:57704 length:1353 start_codon:yes stop_codon:yes gene_type:complete
MEAIPRLIRIIAPLLLMFTFLPANGQFLKKLGKRAEKAAERTIERRVEKETAEKTDQVLDSILEPGQKKDPTPKTEQSDPTPQVNGAATDSDTRNQNQNGGNSEMQIGETDTKSITVYSKFDFVPGDKILFFEDFSNDFIGDFPSKWNTNGGGEIVTMNDSPEKWFELISGYGLYFIPDVPDLPEEYTIEFDIMAVGLDNKTSSTAILRVALSDDNKFKDGANFVHAHLPFCQYSAIGITMANHINNKREIYSTVRADLREEVLNRPHISIAVNKERFRLWVNEEKHIDIPRIVPQGAVLKTLKFHMNNFKDAKERIFITNLKVAEGGLDLRRTLISEGKVSTNGILFDSGSANIQPQSMGIIRQISQVLQQETAMKLKIVGHTDADGENDANLILSKKRADAVKNALVSIYSIGTDRLSTAGKGETEPIGDNSNADGKAQNRRVEFIKQ